MVWFGLVKTSQNSPLKITFFQVRVEIMLERSSCCPRGNDDYIFQSVEECNHHATRRRS